MLTKTQTINRLPWAVSGTRRLSMSMRACAAWATLEEHDKILDLSCEDGQLLSYLNDRMRLTLCGLCESPDQARGVREALMDADVISGRMDDIPWRDCTFNAVLLSGGLPGENARRILQETLRVMRVGGQFVLSVPLLHGKDEELSSREIMRLMQETGFQEVSFRASFPSGVIVGWKKAELEA